MEYVNEFSLEDANIAKRWNAFDKKHNKIYFWCALLNRSLIKLNLSKRGLDLDYIMCPINHVLFTCELIQWKFGKNVSH